MLKFDFSGWATRANLKCSDGRVITSEAFKDCDGKKVPLVWNHQHNDPHNVLGHAVLEHRDEGVYAYGLFNSTPAGRDAKTMVRHGDVSALSIHANRLKQRGADVLHGTIREVSLVLAGANPGAFIEEVIRHGDECDDEAIIYSGEEISLYHSEDDKKEDVQIKKNAETKIEVDKEDVEEVVHDDNEETVGDVFNSLSTKQRNVVYALIGQVLADQGNEAEHSEGGEVMKRNIFDKEDIQDEDVLTHADMLAVFTDARRLGSLKAAIVEHGLEDINSLRHDEQNYGIRNIEYLFPEARNLDTPPSLITRDMGWVPKVFNATRKTPFSRIKSIHADLTEDEARARGYMKGKRKVEEVFSLLKRTTTPQTVYKKQKLDRDDIVDITDFDVVAWLKREMRVMLDEEISRAILVGDGRLASSDDKIHETHIRPVWTDDDLYTIKATVDQGDTLGEIAREFIKVAVRARKDYKGSGNPTLFTTEEMLTEMLLLEDLNMRRIYDTEAILATAMRVREIVTVPVMEGLERDGRKLAGIIVNLTDYNVGADRGGAVNMFDDFDIDYNQQKYLIETRCSGALIRPFSAIAIECANKLTVAQG